MCRPPQVLDTLFTPSPPHTHVESESVSGDEIPDKCFLEQSPKHDGLHHCFRPAPPMITGEVEDENSAMIDQRHT